MRRSAYWSEDLKTWVLMERKEDGEWCHTPGYESREEALGLCSGSSADWVHPCDREEA
jgi:hypothetical protein